jgi:hypothetical protein
MFTAIFALVIGVASLWMGYTMIKSYLHIKNWERTEAKVLSKKVENQRGYYAVKVEYKYFFDSIDYIGNTVHAIEFSGGKSQYRYKKGADQVVTKIGEKIIVYVNPDKPSQSFIFRPGIILSVFVVLMGFFALLYGITGLIKIM